LKAALILEGIEPRRTHDLDDLRNRLPDDWRVKRRMPNLGRLSDYAAESRYPDDMTPVTAIQSATAVRQAIVVVRLVCEDFDRHGIETKRIAPR
jgi:HEPN domain-containing protein